MKTHGGRFPSCTPPIGDNVHEYLAPCIYEGEGEMLGLAFSNRSSKPMVKRTSSRSAKRWPSIR